MIIKKINIVSFGTLRDFSAELSDGINIISGANESGKSTILAFIRFIFYGLPSRRSEEGVLEHDRALSWQDGVAEGSIEIECEKGSFRIERRGIRADNRDGYSEKCQIIDLSTGSAVLKGEVKDVLLLDVAPLSLGVETAGGICTKIIEKNTTIPCRKSEVFSTAQDNQPLVSVHVLQGEREMAADNKTLARFELVGIPPAPRGVPQIEVTFEIDANGIVHVSAMDLGTGKKQQIRVTASSGLSEQQIEKMVREASLHADEDRDKKEMAEARNNAEALLYTTERSLEEYASMLPLEDLAAIESGIEALKQALTGHELAALKEAHRALEDSAYRIAELIYQSDAMG